MNNYDKERVVGRGACGWAHHWFTDCVPRCYTVWVRYSEEPP